MKVLISHPTGNANVRAAVKGLHEAELLKAFYTCIATFDGNLLGMLSKLPPLAELRRRKFDAQLTPFTNIHPTFELARILAGKLGYKKLIENEKGIFSIDAIYRDLDRHVESALKKMSVNAVYSYEDGALHSFRKAKQLGVKCLYDLPIGYWRTSKKLLETENDRWPEWSATLTTFSNSDEKLRRKDDELSLADNIFVASSFTASTLNDFPGKLAPVQVIPYGFPPVDVKNKSYSFKGDRPLKILFVGGLSQRKGIADLFAVAEKLGKHVELTIVGRKTTNACAALDAALIKHKWIPSLPHKQILELMSANDILVFPSLFEGFGLVISEAMSRGTPVITTDRTAGPDLIKHNQNGWLINAGNTDLLLGSVENLLSNPKNIEAAGISAAATANARPWGVYSKELADSISKL